MYSTIQVCTSIPPPVIGDKNFPCNYFNSNPVAYYPQHNAYIPPFPVNNCNGYVNPEVHNFNNGNTSIGHLSHPNHMQFTQPPPGFPVTSVPPYSQFNGQPSFPPQSQGPVARFTDYQSFPPSTTSLNNFHRPPTFTQNSTDSQFNSNNYRPFGNNFRKIRIEKTSYHCTSCDRNFVTEEQYDKHIGEHITCRLEGCTFNAHPKVVEKHVSMQHRNGLFNRIVKGNSPEEIEKWIKERKKFFPTSQKIAEKQAQKEEMEKRGERYNEHKKQFNNRRQSRGLPNRSQNDYRKKRPFNSNPRRSNQGLERSDVVNSHCVKTTESVPRRRNYRKGEEEVEDECVLRNLPPFRGFDYYLHQNNVDEVNASEEHSAVINDSNFIISDDEWSVPEEKLETSAVLQLDQNLGSDDEQPSLICSDPSIQQIDLSTREDTSDGLDSSRQLRVEMSIKTTSQPIFTNALDLLKGYDSTEESEPEGNLGVACEATISKVISADVNDSDDSGPEECSSKVPLMKDTEHTPKYEEIPSATEPKRQTRKRKRKDSKNEDCETAAEGEERSAKREIAKQPRPMPTRRYRPPSLLEKLLASEIKHERNVILQCVRYAVSKNYFEIGQLK